MVQAKIRVLKGRLMWRMDERNANRMIQAWRPHGLMNRPFRTDISFGLKPGTSCRALMSGPLGTETKAIHAHETLAQNVEHDL